MDKATLEKIEYARRLKSEGKYQQSLQVFRQVLQADPKNPYVLRSIGFVLVSQEKFAQSIKEFQKAVQINPDSAEGQMGLAISLMGLRRFEESLAIFQQEMQRYEKHSITPPRSDFTTISVAPINSSKTSQRLKNPSAWLSKFSLIILILICSWDTSIYIKGIMTGLPANTRRPSG